MDSTDCFLEILSAYQSSDSGCQVSLLEYCHRFGVDYYKFLGWYRVISANWVTQLPLPVCNWPLFM